LNLRTEYYGENRDSSKLYYKIVKMRTVSFGQRLFEPELIIFDKDGTITDFRKTWIPIFEKRVEILLDRVGLNNEREKIIEELRKSYGIHEENVDAYGPLPYSTPWEDEIIFASILYRFGIPWQKAKTAARYANEKAEELIDRFAITELYEGVREVLEILRAGGILISLATADLSSITADILKFLKIYDLFDYIIGVDMVDKDKPDPEMIHKTVGALNADIKKAVLVGDSIVDMEMGKRAEVGLVVGVLESGVALRKDLEKDADVVIDSVRNIKLI
jgi:phosphoglycolate phosphatase